MKQFIIWIAILSVLLFVIPLASVNFQSGTTATQRSVDDCKIKLFLHKENKTISIKLSDYIFGTVAAEMPASFEFEALKAQAVATRTYTLNKLKKITNAPEHNGADMCDDFSHCQAYLPVYELKKKWGKNASLYIKKCKNAVLETSGLTIMYKNQPAIAVFHSSSNGKTQNSKDVWGKDVPYLISVESPGEEKCPVHTSEVVLSCNEFKNKISENFKVDFKKEFIGEIVRNSSGYVNTVSIGGTKLKGTQIRTIFGLRSTDFSIKSNESDVTFCVVGNGHGVGMSQYGANYLASEGYDFKKILKAYYTDTKIKKLKTLNE